MKRAILFAALLLFCSGIVAQAAMTGSWESGSTSTFSGWACDPALSADEIGVEFWDGPSFEANSANYLGFAWATSTSASLSSSCGGTINHAFSIIPPTTRKDGRSIIDGNTHTIYAYMNNYNHPSTYPLIGGAPKTINFGPQLSTCSGTRSTAGNSFSYLGVRFTTISNTVDSNTINKLTMYVQNTESIAKTVTYYQYQCRCQEHKGKPFSVNGDGLGYCWYYWSPGDTSTMCLATEETISLASFETKNIQVSVGQYQNKACGSYQLDFQLVSINGVVTSWPLTGWSFTDLCQDCSGMTGDWEYADCTYFSGWACDSSHPTDDIGVEFWDGAGFASGKANYLGYVEALSYRADVSSVCGGNSYHGFTLSTPTTRLDNRSIKDGTQHTIYAYLHNYNTGEGYPPISGAPKRIICSFPTTSTTLPTTTTTTTTTSSTTTTVVGYNDVSFSYKVTDDNGVKDCSIWTNISGSWRINQTSFSITNGGVNSFIIKHVPFGTYRWDIQCFDSINQEVNATNAQPKGYWVFNVTEATSTTSTTTISTSTTTTSTTRPSTTTTTRPVTTTTTTTSTTTTMCSTTKWCILNYGLCSVCQGGQCVQPSGGNCASASCSSLGLGGSYTCYHSTRDFGGRQCCFPTGCFNSAAGDDTRGVKGDCNANADCTSYGSGWTCHYIQGDIPDSSKKCCNP